MCGTKVGVLGFVFVLVFVFFTGFVFVFVGFDSTSRHFKSTISCGAHVSNELDEQKTVVHTLSLEFSPDSL